MDDGRRSTRRLLGLIVLAIAVPACSDSAGERDGGAERERSATATAVGDDGPKLDAGDDSDWAEFAVDVLAAPAPGQVAVPTPAEPVSCPTATTTVSDAGALTLALDGAAAGDVIELAAGTYAGNFVATAEATADRPIFLCATPDAVLAGEGPEESGYVLHLDGADHWRVVGLTVRDGRKGVMVDGGVGNVLQGLTVTSIGDEAIHLRSDSTDNLVIDNLVSDTGIRRDKFGEGIYVGTAQSNWCEYTDCEPDRSDRNRVEGNRISGTTSEAIDVKEGTVDGLILNNEIDGASISAADSWLDVKGNEWIVAGNRLRNGPEHGIQTHEIIDGWGSGNAFIGNVLDVSADGFGFDMHGPADSNLIACDNEVTEAGDGFSNEPCR